ncbi:MAG: TonB-dependent receptor [Caulobacteraceae bacterium]|jgi:iron complex outermembrane receptor protein
MTRLRKLLLAGALAGLTPVPALAWQAAPQQVASADLASTAYEAEAVVVTARRTTERAIDVPISLTAVSGQDLAKTGAYTLADLQAQVPSFTAYQSNARNSSVGIRGIGVSSAADGLDTSVGVYVDGVYLGRPGMALADLIDIDQVEVLRGPQGTLFGRNSSAGALNITTAKPSFNFGGTGEVSAGDYGYNQERLSVTGPIVADQLAFRLTAFNTYREGDLANTTTGIGANSISRQGARVQFLWTPSSDLTVRLIADYSREDDTCCVSVFKQVLAPSVSSATRRTLNVFDELGYVPVANYDAAVGNSPQDMRTDQHSASAEVDWKLGWATLTSITAYRFWHFDPLQDSDNTPLDVIQVNAAITQDTQFSEELRLASNPGRFNWQAGIYLFNQQLRDHYLLNQFGAQASDFYTDYLRTTKPAAAPVSIAAGSQYIGDTRAITDSAALFGQANYEVTKRFTLTAGLRYTHDDKHGVTNTSTVGTPYVTTSIPFHYDIDVKGDNLSWLGSATYKLNRDNTFYGSYSTGYKSAGLNLNSAVGAGVPLVLQPEHVHDWEVGIKQALFDHRLLFDVGGYWETLSGLQANIYPTNGAKSYLANVGDIRARGVEADVTWDVTHGLTLSANGSYNDAVYTSYTNAPCPVGGAAVCNLTGAPVYEAPRWIANAQAAYHFRLSDRVEPYVLAQYAFRSSADGTVDDGPLTRIPAYSLVNARLGASLADGRYDVSLWVQNAFNTHYFENLGTDSIPGAGTFAIGGQPGTPRTWGATVRATF